MGRIFNIQHFAIHDGPGIRTTVFLKGCPLDCRWCHNPESQRGGAQVLYFASRCSRCGACQLVCPEQAVTVTDQRRQTACSGCGRCIAVCPQGALELVGRQVSVDEVLTELYKDEPFYDQSGGGVTFSGGEPLAQPEFLLALLQAARANHWHTAVDTSGYAPWDLIEQLQPLVNLWLYDLKLMDDELHQRYTGVSNRLILDNLLRLTKRSRVEIRVPVIPGINETEANWQQLVSFLQPLAVQAVKLLPYHNYGAEKYERLGQAYQLPDTLPPSEQRMRELQQSLQSAGLPAVLSVE